MVASKDYERRRPSSIFSRRRSRSSIDILSTTATISSVTERSSSSSTGATHETADTSLQSEESHQPTKRNCKPKPETTDDLPMRGNKGRATATNRPSHQPDVEAFLMHIATHDPQKRHPYRSASQARNDGGFTNDGHRVTHTPQYAYRGHADMSSSFDHQYNKERDCGLLSSAIHEASRAKQDNDRDSLYTVLDVDSRTYADDKPTPFWQAILRRCDKDRKIASRKMESLEKNDSVAVSDAAHRC